VSRAYRRSRWRAPGLTRPDAPRERELDSFGGPDRRGCGGVPAVAPISEAPIGGYSPPGVPAYHDDVGAKFGGIVCLALGAGMAVFVLAGCSLLPAGAPVVSTETLAAGITPNKDPLPAPSAIAGDETADATDEQSAGSPGDASSAPADPAAPVALVSVTPLIVSSSWDATASALTVDAFVSSITEDGGTCSLVAELDGSVVSVESAAFAAAQSTECGELALPGLAQGTWSVRVEYASDRSAGVSDSVDVAVTS
jgi:hypothetical protein